MIGTARTAICFGIALTLGACSSDPDESSACRLPADATVLAIGDSITRGYGAVGHGYAEQLQALFSASPTRSGVRVLNQGIDGERSAGLLARLDKSLGADAPAVVLITTGGNDLLRRVDATETRTNLTAIVEQVRAAGAYPVIFAVPKPSVAAAAGFASDHPMFAELSEATGTEIIPDVVADVLSKPELRSDEIHPNAGGYALMAQAAFDALADCE